MENYIHYQFIGKEIINTTILIAQNNITKIKGEAIKLGSVNITSFKFGYVVIAFAISALDSIKAII